MTRTISLGARIPVVVWRESLGEMHPLGHPVENPAYAGRRIEVVDGTVGSVVEIRVDRVEPSRVLGRVVDYFGVDSPEWERANALLGTDHGFEVVTEKRRRIPRLVIRRDRSYWSDWEEQRRNTFDQVVERP